MPPNAVMRYVSIDFMNCRDRMSLAACPAAIRRDAFLFMLGYNG